MEDSAYLKGLSELFEGLMVEIIKQRPRDIKSFVINQLKGEHAQKTNGGDSNSRGGRDGDGCCSSRKGDGSSDDSCMRGILDVIKMFCMDAFQESAITSSPILRTLVTDFLVDVISVAQKYGYVDTNQHQSDQLFSHNDDLLLDLQDAVILTRGDDDNTSETSSDEEDEGSKENIISHYQRHANKRSSVSAAAFGQYNPIEEARKVVDGLCAKLPTKSNEEIGWLRDKCKTVFAIRLNCADEQTIDRLISLMEQRTFDRKTVVMEAGQFGEGLYIIEEGSVSIRNQNENEAILVAGNFFGELALMHTLQQKMTVTTRERSTMWFLSRSTFSFLVRETLDKKCQRMREFVLSCSLFEGSTESEIAAIAENLQEQTFKEGVDCIEAGQAGSVMYLLMEGSAQAYLADDNVMIETHPEYQRGDYFGEISILEDCPRRVSVKAVTAIKVAWLNRRAVRALPDIVQKRLREGIESYSSTN